MKRPIPDREAAGRELTRALEGYRGREPLVVLALPRGGVPVGAEIARRLGAELDVMIVRKLGMPGQPELAMGAIASGGARIINREWIDGGYLSEESLQGVIEREHRELERREKAYRGSRPWPNLDNATVILVDDGLATGASMKAALAALKHYGVRDVVVAVPVAPADTIAELRDLADDVVCLATPSNFRAIGLWYETFDQVPDDEVRRLLDQFW